MSQRNDLAEYLLRLGDSALVTGQRLCEWCGRAPALEEELALMNVGLDLIGQARGWYDYAAELLDDGRNADALAFKREERDFRNLLIVEQPNGDYAITTLKLFFYDAWHLPTLEQLSESSDERIAGVAGKALKEARYHFKRSSEWVIRLGDGTDESHRRISDAVDRLWRYTIEMVNIDPLEQELAKTGLAADPAFVAEQWQARVAKVFEEATLKLPEPAVPFYLNGRQGLHTEHLGQLLAEMQFLPRAYPDATW
ncbi:1,2-phenylacetyl-CoA epoxidase subunit PaaC [Mangrovitalea sediminis]|uniref:1,2-phenylacetyl-CoA epoxidase subunit PaaC n=1 Tax=Mangrovitalea sediminis TaxID=1982043 RepID=UPI000BE5DF17|nr:1,2-phenylacetyl-CoA epoxidase subunit PaaC [Mangrovitalea sediminis]